MGKAISRWIISLLLGKKEEKKDKKNSIEALPSSLSHNNTLTPKVKRRWSFGKTRKDSTNSKPLIRLGSDHFIRRTIQIENDLYQNDDQAALSMSRDIENAAAVKIQSIFRSYLAKKALCALRGIVKVQALARGHLVRKRTASTLHRMHALMTIQLRARLHRLHNQQPYLFPLNPPTHTTEKMSVNEKERLGNAKSRNGYLNQSRNGYLNQSRVESKIDTTYYSGSLSLSEQQRVLHYQEDGPKIYPARASYSFERPDHRAHTYMAATQSSKAKVVRSSSEPKQRPNLKITSKNNMDTRSQLSSSHSLHFPPHTVVDPCFLKLYGSPTRSSTDCDYEHGSLNSNSNFYPSLDAYELPVTLY